MPVLFDEFDRTNKETWITKANADLKGAKTTDEITYDIEPGLSVSPFLTNEDQVETQPMVLPHTVTGAIILEANHENVIAALEQGAQALMIKLLSADNLDRIFKDVVMDIITFIIDDNDASLDDRKEIKGFFGPNVQVIYMSEGTIQLDKNASFVERIALVKSNPSQPVFLQLKDDFLAQIAELQALRKIGASHIYAFSRYEDDQLQNHGTLIAHTYQLMAAHLGGADIAFGPKHSEGHDFGRLGLNIQHMLGMESQLGLVTNPMAGSYIIDEMVEKMVNA